MTGLLAAQKGLVWLREGKGWDREIVGGGGVLKQLGDVLGQGCTY